MADAITEVSEAISTTLDGAGVFHGGTAWARRLIGGLPSYMIWQDGFSISGGPEAKTMPERTTFRFQIELYSKLTGNEKESQERFRALLQSAVKAFRANPRLNGKCLASKVMEGTSDMGREGNNDYLQATIILDVVRTDW